MAAAGGPLQGQARPGQACWPPSRVTASAVTRAASLSPEAAAPLRADLRHMSDPSISSLQQFGSRRFDSFDSTRYCVPLRCSGCTHEFDLEKPPVLQEVADFFSGHGIEDFTFSRGRLSEWRCRAKLVVRGTPEKPLIGLYREGTHTVQDIPDCRGRTGGTATSDGMKPGHGNPPQPSRPRRRSVLWGSLSTCSFRVPGPQIDAVTNDNIVINVFNNLI
uniref:Putative RNA methyltransferase n=1 Tax=Aegilops tauschii TaxID=37682 RepID=M8BG25_AEGTA